MVTDQNREDCHGHRRHCKRPAECQADASRRNECHLIDEAKDAEGRVSMTLASVHGRKDVAADIYMSRCEGHGLRPAKAVGHRHVKFGRE